MDDKAKVTGFLRVTFVCAYSLTSLTGLVRALPASPRGAETSKETCARRRLYRIAARQHVVHGDCTHHSRLSW